MTLQPRRRENPRWPLIVALLAPPAIIGAVLVSTFSSGEVMREDMWVGATTFGPTSTAPPDAVQAVHDALHDIGTKCRAARPDFAAITADVDSIVAFAERYPIGRFPIDDETATAASLLLVTKEATNDCAPADAARIEAAIRRAG